MTETPLSPEHPRYNHGRRSLDYVRWTYGVPARRGMRVRADGKLGTITCGDGHYIRVRIDGEKRSGRWHPTWNMEYEPNEHVCPRCGDDEHLMADIDGCSFTLLGGELSLVGTGFDGNVECCGCGLTGRFGTDAAGVIEGRIEWDATDDPSTQ